MNFCAIDYLYFFPHLHPSYTNIYQQYLKIWCRIEFSQHIKCIYLWSSIDHSCHKPRPIFYSCKCQNHFWYDHLSRVRQQMNQLPETIRASFGPTVWIFPISWLQNHWSKNLGLFVRCRLKFDITLLHLLWGNKIRCTYT